MKKIIIAFDGDNFSEGGFEFARKLNEANPILLTGVFMPDAEMISFWRQTESVGNLFTPPSEVGISSKIQKTVALFEKRCQANGIDYRVEKDFYDFVIPELKKESRFADLMILGSEVFFHNVGNDASHEYLEDILINISCPVLVVPEKFVFPESVILAYDGSEDSVFAIKQFAYLLPELKENKTLLVYATDDYTEDFPDKIHIQELAARHFPDLTLYKLELNAKKYFGLWISHKKSAILVSGAFGGSAVKRFFRKSFINEVIGEHSLPVFIAHK